MSTTSLAELRKRFFIATQKPPFLAAYRATYDAALRFVTSRVAFRKGVAALYLTSGMLDEPVYGLSDIDLTVVVDDERARGHLVTLLGQLRVVVPMLGPVEQQIVWTRAELERRFRGSPFVQYRLGGGRALRLLHGGEVLAGLVADAPPLRQALAEIRFAWEVLLPLLAGAPRADANHLYRKVLADIVRATRFAAGERLAARSACLERVAGVVDAALLDVARQPLLHPAIAPADAFRAVHQVLRAFAASLPLEPPTRELALDGLPAALDPDLGIAGARAAPSLWLDGAAEDRLGCARPRAHVTLAAPPSGAELRTLCGRRDVEVTAELDGVLYPFSDEPVCGVATRATHPEMFGELGISAARFAIAAARSAERRAAVGELLDSRAVFNHDVASLRLLCCVSRERVEDGRLVVPASSDLEPPGEARDLIRRLCLLCGRDPRLLLGDDAQRLTLAVLICTRDRAALLRSALQSIAAQGRAPDEVVVVDNGSSDDTRAVVDGFADRLPIRYAFLAEPSIPAARNAALRLATADVLCFLDDDAVADRDWLRRFEETFRADPQIGVVGGSIWPLATQRGAIADFHRWMQGRP